MIQTYDLMLYGFIIAEQLFIALYFARFWHATRDRLFLFLAAGFVVMSIHRISLGFARAEGIALDQQTWFFVIRAISYLLIFAGILDKNLSRRRARV